jgi:hypothetical protein
MHKLTMAIVAAAGAAILASPVVAETVYVYRDPGYTSYVVTEPRVYVPSTPVERVYVDRPYYAYDSYYVWDPLTMRYVPRYRYRVVDDSGRSYPVTAAEASRLYGYPYGYDGNPGYLYWNGNRVALAPDRGLTRDSNPDDYSSGHYNPKP